jgi:hypothetical protein
MFFLFQVNINTCLAKQEKRDDAATPTNCIDGGKEQKWKKSNVTVATAAAPISNGKVPTSSTFHSGGMYNDDGSGSSLLGEKNGSNLCRSDTTLSVVNGNDDVWANYTDEEKQKRGIAILTGEVGINR